MRVRLGAPWWPTARRSTNSSTLITTTTTPTPSIAHRPQQSTEHVAVILGTRATKQSAVNERSPTDTFIMSANAQGDLDTKKAVVQDDASKDQQKPATALEEDDEFEDFPVEGELGRAAEFGRSLNRLPACPSASPARVAAVSSCAE